MEDAMLKRFMRLLMGYYVIAGLMFVTVIVGRVFVSFPLYGMKLLRPPATFSQSWVTRELAVCQNTYGGLTTTDLAGMAEAMHEIHDDARVDAILQHWFGPTWEDRFEFRPIVAGYVMFGQFRVRATNVTIFAFSGMRTVLDAVWQVEMYVGRYVVPFLLELCPLFDFYRTWLVPGVQAFFTAWGSGASSHETISQFMIDPVIEALGGATGEVVTTGMGVGGLIAKAVSIEYGWRSVTLLSWGTTNELAAPVVSADIRDSALITTTFFDSPRNADREEDVGEQFVLPWFQAPGLRNEGRLHALCLLAEACNPGRLDEFCRIAIGEENVASIGNGMAEVYDKSGA